MTTQTQTKLNGMESAMNAGVAKMEDQLVKFSNETGKKFGAIASDIADSTTEYIETGRKYVKQNPATGVAIAAGAGIIVGSLLTMALRKK